MPKQTLCWATLATLAEWERLENFMFNQLLSEVTNFRYLFLIK